MIATVPAQAFPLPQHMLQLFEACTESPPQKPVIAILLRRDPALLASFLSCIHAVADVTPADGDGWLAELLAPLGEQQLQSLAVSMAADTCQATPSGTALSRLRQLHEQSAWLAALAAALACQVADVESAEAELAGQMHNLGKLLLFARSPQGFVDGAIPVIPGPEALGVEAQLWGSDHIETGTDAASAWPIDAFVSDAIRHQYDEPARLASTTALVRLLHCAVRLSREDTLSPETIAVCEKLLGCREEQLEAIMLRAREKLREVRWTQQDDEAFEARQTEALDSLRQALSRFSKRCIDQQLLLSAPSASALLENLRRILSRHFPDMFLFKLRSDRRSLQGVPLKGQPRRLAQISAPCIQGDNLVAHCHLSGEVTDSFSAESFAVGALDQQIAALVGSAGFCCIPLRHGNAPLGVLLLAADAATGSETLYHPDVRALINCAAGQLARLSAAGNGSREDEISLLTREIYHELSNPLTAIRNYLFMLKRETDGEARPVIDQVESEVSRLADMLSRYRQRGQDNPQVQETVNLNRLITDTAERIADSAPAGTRVETRLDSSVPMLLSSRVALEQILVNLITNAIEALADQGAVIVTSADNWQQGDRKFVEVRVEDNGPGLPTNVLDTLFHPVTSTKGGDHSGLGLSIVKNLCDETGIKISCHSDAQGTRFQLLIPRLPGTHNDKEHTHDEFEAQQRIALQ